ncbi:MAG: hypothetical protein Q8Q09_00245 [Deltaproteobacteria bacterium]|nr:hypothetical protein [Deltaproteobacteria bacterium]
MKFGRFAWVWLSLVSVGCGPASTSDAGTDGAMVADASDATARDVVRSEFCGTQVCLASQICVVPCCGGPAPQCLPPDDAGVCPMGSTMTTCRDGMVGCVMSCTPAPPSCVTPPPESECNGTTCPACPTGSGIRINGLIQCLCA